MIYTQEAIVTARTQYKNCMLIKPKLILSIVKLGMFDLVAIKAQLVACKSFKELYGVVLEFYRHALGSTSVGASFVATANEKYLSPTSQIVSDKLGLKLKITSATKRDEIFAEMDEAQIKWNVLGIKKRLKILQKFVDGLKRKEVQEYLAFTLMVELGKDAASVKSELAKTAEYLDYYLADGFADALEDKIDNGIILQRRPRGCVGIITSANYPIALSMPALIAGLFAGNSVIIKPTSKAMLWSFTIKELFVQAAGTEFSGLLQIIIGYEMDFYNEVDSLFFVGSEETGKMIRQSRFLYRLENNLLENGTDIFELGGISPAVVLKSHAEVMETAKAIFAGVTGNSGQRCTATKILLLEDGVDPALLKNFESYFANFDKAQLDMPFVERAKYGPIFDENVMVKISAAKEIAEKFNLKMIGGDLVERVGGGRYITPLLINATGLQDEAALKFIFQCEVFGPIVFVFENVDSIIEMCKRIDQPLACGFFGSIDELEAFRTQTNFGSINHNKTAKDLSPYGSHGARFRSGGSTNDATTMVNALTYAVSYTKAN